MPRGVVARGGIGLDPARCVVYCRVKGLAIARHSQRWYAYVDLLWGVNLLPISLSRCRCPITQRERVS